MAEEAVPNGEAAPDEGSQSFDRGDFEARLDNDPEFSARKYKEVQAQFSQAQNSLKESEELREFAKQVGRGDMRNGFEAIKGWLTQYNQVKSNATLSKTIDKFLETGRLPESIDDTPTADEYEDPRDKVIRELETKLDALTGSVTRLEHSGANDWLNKHLGKFFESFPLDDERRTAVLSTLAKNVGEYQQSDMGRSTVRSIMGPDGYKTVRALALSALEDADFERVGERKYLNNLEEKRGRSTEIAPSVRSTGREATGSDDPVEGIKRFARDINIDLDNLSDYF